MELPQQQRLLLLLLLAMLLSKTAECRQALSQMQQLLQRSLLAVVCRRLGLPTAARLNLLQTLHCGHMPAQPVVQHHAALPWAVRQQQQQQQKMGCFMVFCSRDSLARCCKETHPASLAVTAAQVLY
jgi:hypothetical protein